ncbi:hypothetical protein Tco_1002030 [Tanacetum coccineum]|uniref:Uncharacterized protein n=1 Tax=Tanacetum coccineum TaxID=301880 RepID=A0ABQ5F6Z7_9ASTR
MTFRTKGIPIDVINVHNNHVISGMKTISVRDYLPVALTQRGTSATLIIQRVFCYVRQERIIQRQMEEQKSDEDATYEWIKEMKAVQATQEIEDTHVTLTPVNPDGQQHSSSVSSGFVSNMLNPNQYTGVDDISEQHTEATSLTDTPITAIVEPSFSGAVDVAVQLKYDRIREESNTENQQFLDSIDEGMKKVIKEQSERSRMMIKDPTLETDRGSKRRRSGKEPASSSAPRETITTTTGKTTTTGSKTHKQSASQSAPVEETMQTTNVFEAPAYQEFETGVHDEQEEEESVPAVHESVQPWIAIWPKGQDPRESFDELTDTTFDFSAFVMNRLNVKTLTPELLAGPTFELIEWTCSKFD